MIEMAERKVTKKDMFKRIMEVCGASYPDIMEFCEKELILIERKKASSATTANKEENASICEFLIQEMQVIGRPVTVSELMNESPNVQGYITEKGTHLSNQKISYILNNCDKVAKVTEKKKSYFSIKA